MSCDGCGRHVCHHDGYDFLASLQSRLLLRLVLRRQLRWQGLGVCHQFVACAPMRHLLLLGLPSCLRAADLEVQCLERQKLQHLEQLGLLGEDEAYLAELQHLQREFCCGCAHHACRDDAFLLRLEFLEYVADQTVVRRPVAARG